MPRRKTYYLHSLDTCAVARVDTIFAGAHLAARSSAGSFPCSSHDPDAFVSEGTFLLGNMRDPVVKLAAIVQFRTIHLALWQPRRQPRSLMMAKKLVQRRTRRIKIDHRQDILPCGRLVLQDSCVTLWIVQRSHNITTTRPQPYFISQPSCNPVKSHERPATPVGGIYDNGSLLRVFGSFSVTEVAYRIQVRIHPRPQCNGLSLLLNE